MIKAAASWEIDDSWRVHTDLEFLISSKAREAVRREDILIIDYRDQGLLVATMDAGASGSLIDYR